MSFSRSLSIAWRKIDVILFKPFSAAKWFALGFSAWLASFVHDRGLSIFNRYGGGHHHSSTSSQAFLDRQPDGWLNVTDAVSQWAGVRWGGAGHNEIFSAPLLGVFFTLLVIVVLFALLAVLVVMLWTGSRGQFMFVDNLVHNRAEVVRPWKQFRHLGNSLFWFQLAAGILIIVATLTVILVSAAGFLFSVFGNFAPDNFKLLTWLKCWPSLAAWGALLLAYVLAVAGAHCLFMEFGVLLMYRFECGALQALRRLWDLFWLHPWKFLLYLLVRFGLGIVFLVVLLVLCCGTCCIAALPYLNAVLSLPLRVFRFGFTMDCLAQLGPEYELLPRTGEVQPR